VVVAVARTPVVVTFSPVLRLVPGAESCVSNSYSGSTGTTARISPVFAVISLPTYTNSGTDVPDTAVAVPADP
jgi:hypothetical protein